VTRDKDSAAGRSEIYGGALKGTKYRGVIPEEAEAYFAAWESQHNKSK